MSVGLGLGLAFMHCLSITFCVFFWFSLDCFVLVSFVFVVLDFVCSALCPEIG